MRFDPKLIVLSNVPTKTFLLFALTSRQPLPPIIFSPRLALLPLIMMLVVLPAISPSKNFCTRNHYEAIILAKAKQGNPRNSMANFTPISAAIGGALIGLAAVLLMAFNGRIAGVAGITGGLVNPKSDDRPWRLAFIVGLIAAPLAAALLGHAVPMPQMPGSMIVIAVAGVLVGFGTRLGNGCTSGHGICGIARLSPRSIAATLVFMVAAMIVVALTRHVIGG
jgi:hypothetical protein